MSGEKDRLQRLIDLIPDEELREEIRREIPKIPLALEALQRESLATLNTYREELRDGNRKLKELEERLDALETPPPPDVVAFANTALARPKGGYAWEGPACPKCGALKDDPPRVLCKSCQYRVQRQSELGVDAMGVPLSKPHVLLFYKDFRKCRGCESDEVRVGATLCESCEAEEAKGRG